MTGKVVAPQRNNNASPRHQSVTGCDAIAEGRKAALLVWRMPEREDQHAPLKIVSFRFGENPVKMHKNGKLLAPTSELRTKFSGDLTRSVALYLSTKELPFLARMNKNSNHSLFAHTRKSEIFWQRIATRKFPDLVSLQMLLDPSPTFSDLFRKTLKARRDKEFDVQPKVASTMENYAFSIELRYFNVCRGSYGSPLSCRRKVADIIWSWCGKGKWVQNHIAFQMDKDTRTKLLNAAKNVHANDNFSDWKDGFEVRCYITKRRGGATAVLYRGFYSREVEPLGEMAKPCGALRKPGATDVYFEEFSQFNFQRASCQVQHKINELTDTSETQFETQMQLASCLTVDQNENSQIGQLLQSSNTTQYGYSFGFDCFYPCQWKLHPQIWPGDFGDGALEVTEEEFLNFADHTLFFCE
jgi:hypothetical protein